MSPSNDLIPTIDFRLQKVKNEWFKENYAKYLRIMMPAWKIWFEEVLKKDAIFCLGTIPISRHVKNFVLW